MTTVCPSRGESYVQGCGGDGADKVADDSCTVDNGDEAKDREQGGSQGELERTLDGLVHKHSWLNDPKVIWRHPIARIVVAVLILVLDMFLFVEDPVNDSHVAAYLPGLGHIYGFLCTWPASAGSALLRVVLLLVSLVFGCWFGRQVVHHRFLRNYCRLQMFSECNGTLFIMGFCCVGSIFVGCQAYNVILGTWELDGGMGMTMRDFCRMAQCCSVSADIVAILMVLDQVLQDQHHYPNFALGVKFVWNKVGGGWVRVIAFWFLLFSTCALTFWGIFNAGVGDSYNNSRLGGLTESARTLMVSAIIFCDLFTVAQDWEFPSFQRDINVSGEILVGGTFVTELHCDLLTRLVRRLPAIPEGLRRRLPPVGFFTFQMSGSWLAYGPLLIIMGIDLFCTRTQVMYEPENYGQYVRGGDGDGAWQIWAIRDEAYLAEAYSKGNLVKPDWVTFAARWNLTTGDPIGQGDVQDFELKSQHTGSFLRYLCPIPGLATMLIFGVLVAYGNRRRIEVVRRSTIVSADTTPPGEDDADRPEGDADRPEEEEEQAEAAERGVATPPRSAASLESLANMPEKGSPQRLEATCDSQVLSSPSTSAEPCDTLPAPVVESSGVSGEASEPPLGALPGQLAAGPPSTPRLGER